MTVKELIEKLQKVEDKDALVVTINEYDNFENVDKAYLIDVTTHRLVVLVN